VSESGVTEEGSRRVAWRLAILEKHGHHFPEVGVQLVQALALTVRPREAGEITDEDVRIGSRSMTVVCVRMETELTASAGGRQAE